MKCFTQFSLLEDGEGCAGENSPVLDSSGGGEHVQSPGVDVAQLKVLRLILPPSLSPGPAYLVDLRQSCRPPCCDVQVASSGYQRHVTGHGTNPQHLEALVFVGQSSLDTFLQFIINKVVLELVICQGELDYCLQRLSTEY